MIPKISVLVTTYNSEKYVYDAINSLFKQTFSDFEIILVEDGSTDSTKEIIQNFSDPRLKVFYKSNTGLIDSLNFGIKKCSAELVARFDSDDLCINKRLEIQYSNFERTDSVLGSNAFIINEFGEVISSTSTPSSSNSIQKSLMKMNNCIIHPSVLLKKSTLIACGGYSNDYKHAEDYELWLRLLKVGSIRSLNDRLICLRKHQSNISHIYTHEQIKNTIKALLRHSLSALSDEKVSEITEEFIKHNKSFDRLVMLTEKIVAYNSPYYKNLEKLLFKVLYIINKKKIISRFEKKYHNSNQRS